MIDEVAEARNRQQGITTPLELARHLLAVAESGRVEHVVYVARSAGGRVTAGWSDGQLLVTLGLLEAGKTAVFDSMQE